MRARTTRRWRRQSAWQLLREGQVFFVHIRVADIEAVARRLRCGPAQIALTSADRFSLLRPAVSIASYENSIGSVATAAAFRGPG